MAKISKNLKYNVGIMDSAALRPKRWIIGIPKIHAEL
jgi:hypothetical protein